MLLGDNLASHMSEYVISKCEEHKILFCLLPENSTHILQPLDVAVFAPMKTEWQRILREWKDRGAKEGKVYATLPKEEFPALLAKLLQKDFGPSIRSGFAATGIFPLSLEKALSNLPSEEDSSATTHVQQAMLARLKEIRYGNPVRASRPKKSEKLPAGASYTCKGRDGGGDAGDGDASDEDAGGEGDASDSDTAESDSTSSSSSSNENSESEADSESETDKARSENVRSIISRLGKRLKYSGAGRPQQQQDQVEEGEGEDYPVGSFVTAVYEGDWYLGQVLDKKLEPEAEEDADFIYVNFMERSQIGSSNGFRWPVKLDMLNVQLSDIIMRCDPPNLNSCTSSSRMASYVMSQKDHTATKRIFKSRKEFYPIRTIICISFFLTSLLKLQHRNRKSDLNFCYWVY